MKVNKKSILIFLGIITTVGVMCCIRLVTVRTSNETAYPIYITEGETFDHLMDRQQELLIAHPTKFRLMAKARGLDKRLRPGHYLVQPGMKYIDLVQKLSRGQQDPIRLTIGKFRTPDQLNRYLNQKLMHDDFNVTLDSFHLILPDTYEFYWTVTPEAFMQRMEKEFEAESGKWKVESGKRKVENEAAAPGKLSTFLFPLSTKQIIILASIVEEETNNNAEKPLIASVYLNRLERGMPLQADPTVKYAVATSCPPDSGGLSATQTEGFALRRILNKHLAVESPFNTYLHTGLPPAPICLPSKASIHAVLDAPQTGYLYFCASPEMDGTHRFAASLAEHNRNAAAFHRALNARGIR